MHWVLMMIKEYNQLIQQKHMHRCQMKEYIEKEKLNVTIQ